MAGPLSVYLMHVLPMTGPGWGVGALPGCPLVSWMTTRSVTSLALQAFTSDPTSWFPLFILWAPGNMSFTS